MSVRKGQGRTRDYESPNHRQDSRRDYGEEDFLKDKRSPSMFDMLYMYFFSTPARKIAVGILVILLAGAFYVNHIHHVEEVTPKLSRTEPVDSFHQQLEVHRTSEVHHEDRHKDHHEETQPEAEAEAEEEVVKPYVVEDAPEEEQQPEEAERLTQPDDEEEPDKEEEEEARIPKRSSDSSHAKTRWSAVEIPSSCMVPGVLPTGVTAGLELYATIPVDPPPPASPAAASLPVIVEEEEVKLTAPEHKAAHAHEEGESTPVKEQPAEEEVPEDSPSEGSPSEDSPSEDSPSEESPSENETTEGSPSEESPSSEETSVEESPGEGEESRPEEQQEEQPGEQSSGEEEETSSGSEAAGANDEGEGAGAAKSDQKSSHRRLLARASERERERDRERRASERGGDASEARASSRSNLLHAAASKAGAGGGAGEAAPKLPAAGEAPPLERRSRAERRTEVSDTRDAVTLASDSLPPALQSQLRSHRQAASSASADAQRGTYNTLLNWQPRGASAFRATELKVVNLLRNVSTYEAKCQYTTRECATESARELAALLRLNAQAVQDAMGGTFNEEMQKVNANLQNLRNNARMQMNQTELEALGMYGTLGKCAVVGRGEFDDNGNRYDAQVSRFAQVIDAHDTMVYCSAKAHKCIFSSLNEPNVKKVEVDHKSWQSAFAAASQIHQLLAGDDELAGGVQGWGHKGDPTTTFVNALVLLRSGLCERVDIYGETERPTHWLKVVGNGHVVSQPGPHAKDWKLAVALQQERYAYRLFSNILNGKMCFFQ